MLEQKLEKILKDNEKYIKALKDLSSGGSSFWATQNLTVMSKSLKLRSQTITTNYPASSMDFMVLGNATGGNITVTLPPATNTGLLLLVEKIDSSANTVTISRLGSDTISGNTSITLSTQYGGRLLIADGALTWHLISSSEATGGSLNTEVPTGDVDGSNITYTVSNTPKVVIVDGLIRRENKGYTLSGTTITVDSLTPPSYDIFTIY